jgi:hypothetical protein
MWRAGLGEPVLLGAEASQGGLGESLRIGGWKVLVEDDSTGIEWTAEDDEVWLGRNVLYSSSACCASGRQEQGDGDVIAGSAVDDQGGDVALACGEIPVAFSGSQISIASPTHHSDPTAITVVVAIPALGRAYRPLVSWKM